MESLETRVLFDADSATGGTGFPPVQAPPLAAALSFVDQAVFADLGDTLIASGPGGLWRVNRDGTAPQFVAALSVPTPPYDDAHLAVFGHDAYLGGAGEDGVFNLWRTDGTPAGTGLVASVPGVHPLETITDSVEFQGELYFTTMSRNERGLWRTDGTAAGTVRIADAGTVQPDWDVTIERPPYLTVVGGTLLFNAYNVEHGWELWTSDGTADGTHVFVEINQQRLATFGDFNGDSKIDLTDFGILKENFGKEGSWPDIDGDGRFGLAEFGLFKSYFANPALLDNRASASPGELTIVGNAAYFFADDGLHGAELWTTDGTVAGTHLVVDLAPGAASSPRYDSRLGAPIVPRGNEFVFFADDSVHGLRIWQSDGTDAGTRMLAPEGNFSTSGLAVWNDLLFYFQTDTQGESALWRSDGSSAGTVRLLEPSPWSPWHPGPSLVAGDDMVYVLAAKSGGANDLWRTDGTVAGTHLVNPAWSAAGAQPYRLLALADALFLDVLGKDQQFTLWRTTGAADGTSPVFPT